MCHLKYIFLLFFILLCVFLFFVLSFKILNFNSFVVLAIYCACLFFTSTLCFGICFEINLYLIWRKITTIIIIIFNFPYFLFVLSYDRRNKLQTMYDFILLFLYINTDILRICIQNSYICVFCMFFFLCV